MMSPYLAKLKQLSHRRKMHNLSLSLGQHLNQLERLDRELALARRQEVGFYTKFGMENAIENGNEMEDDHDHHREMEAEEEMEMKADAEAEEMELEGPSSDTSSNNSTSTSTSSRTTTSTTSSRGGDQQGQGHGPGIGIDQLKLDQAQVQVHCADDPAPGESGDCLSVKEPGVKSLEEKVSEQPLLTEVPSPLENQNQYFPMPSLRAIKLAAKSKLNAQAAVYEMPSSPAVAPASALVPAPDNSVVPSRSPQPFRLNAKAPVFQPSKEGLELPLSGTIAAAAAGAEATYQLLMRQMNLLHQPPDPLAHIHPLRPYPRLRPHAHLLPHPQAQLMPHPRSQLMPHPRSQLMPHSRSQLMPHPRSQMMPHSRSQLMPHRRSQLMPHPRSQLMPHRRSHLLPTPPQAYQPHVHVHIHPHHNIQGAASQSLLGLPPPPLSGQLMHRNASKQEMRCRKEPLPDLFPEVLTLMGELLRPVSYPEIVTILAARLRRPVVELKRHIPHTLHAAVIHGYLSKEGNRYSLLSEAEHMAIKRRNHEAAQRAKELEKEPLSWRKR